MIRKVLLLLFLIGLFGCAKQGPKGDTGATGKDNQGVTRRVIQGIAGSDAWEVDLGLNFLNSNPIIEVFYFDTTVSGWIEMNVNSEITSPGNKIYVIDALSYLWLFRIRGMQYKIIIFE